MAIKSYKMGPGTLKLGAAGVQDVSCQVRACRVVWTENVETTDPIPTLCGEEIPAEDEVSYRAQLEFTIVQDIDAAGVVAYTWTNKGVEVEFEFVPSTAEARKVTGTVRVIPATIGGDVKARNTADNTWRCTVDPVLAPVV